MSGKWYREKKSPDDEQMKAAETYAANTNRVKRQFHAYQRDGDQNNGDAGIQKMEPTYPNPPEANHRARSLIGQEKLDFLSAIGYHDDDGSGYCLADYLETFRLANPSTNLRSRADLESPDIPLNLLICRNDHSVGLIGKEGSYDTLNDEEPHNLHALVRALGSSQKSGGFGGGTYGFGKILFYDHSKCRMVFYYSRLYKPAKSVFASHTGDITRRFIGVNWLQSDIDMEDNSNMRSRKSHFGIPEDLGEIEGYNGEGTTVRSLYNEEADAAAESIGLKIRDEDEYGTTIVIIDFFNPIKDQEGTNDSYLKEIIESAEFYYYPKMLQNEIVISAEIGGELVFPEPESNEDVQHFQDAFKKTIEGEDADDFVIKKFTVPIPQNSIANPLFDKERDATFVLGVKFTDSTETEPAEKDEAKPRANTTAWIRGPGMVIAHDSLKIGSIAKEYHAVALVGNAVKWCDSWTGDIDEIAQLQAEHLVALSENVSHDRVSQRSKRPDFQSWDGAYGAIRKIREEVRKILKKTVAEQVDTPQGDAAPLFGLDFGKEGAQTTKRTIPIRRLDVTSDPDDSFYLVQFEVILPPATHSDLLKEKDEDNPLYYTRWKVDIPCQFVQEDGSVIREKVRGKVVTCSVEKLDGERIKFGHSILDWDHTETEVPWVEGPFVDDWRRIRIEMETERLPEELASYGRIRAKPTTKLAWEVGE